MATERKSLRQRFREWGNEKTTWKGNTAFGLILAGALGFLGYVLYERHQESLEAKAPFEYVEYRGFANGYKVRIDEDKKGRRVTERRVHLDTITKDGVPYVLSGKDENGDGIWEKFFIQPKVDNGYNCAVFKKDGTWDYEPCSSDKDKVPRFSDDEISRARQLLEDSIKYIRDEAHLVRKKENGDRLTQVEEEARIIDEINKRDKKPEKMPEERKPQTELQLNSPSAEIKKSEIKAPVAVESEQDSPKIEIILTYPSRKLSFRDDLTMPLEACLGQVNPHLITTDNYASFSLGNQTVQTSAGVFRKKADENRLLEKTDSNWLFFERDSEIPVRVLTYELERTLEKE
ncbi:MAG: hypothetical protein PHF67_01410 [Candidatus Nanoarchaeia archaeon]|nr:hypothetical protein [Candidatus Nanoarchaeia archaeon]